MKKIFYCAALAVLAACSNDDDSKSGTPSGPLNEEFTKVRVEGRDHYTDVWFSDENNGVVCGGSGALIRTADGGETWTAVPGLTSSYDCVFMFDKDHLYAGKQDLLKMNAQQEMESIGNLKGGYGSMKDIYFTSAQNGTILKGATVLKTTDGGNNWTVIFDDNYYVRNMTFASPETAYLYGGTTHDGASAAVFYKTTDKGATWTDMRMEGSQALAMSFVDDKNGFAVNFEDEVLRTKDGGVTWVQTGTMANGRYNGKVSCLLYASDKQLFASNFDGELFRSDNAGQDWVRLYEHDADYAILKIFKVNRTVYAVGDNGLILKNNAK